jgi:uncharacterized DUF497 family protein
MAEDKFEFLAQAGFEWDDDKNNANLIKHGIDFEDASEVLRAGHHQRIEPQQ